MHILFNPEVPVKETGSTPSRAPQPNVVKSEQSRESAPPLEILKRTFTTEQLPELDDKASEKLVSDTNIKPKAPSEEKPTKKEKEEKEKEVKKEDLVEGDTDEKLPTEEEEDGKKPDDADDKKPDEKEEDENPLAKFLKPPKGSKEEADLIKKKGSKDTFDYSTYSQEEASILKNMPVSNREKVGKLFKENKELAALKNNQIYQHDSGYILHPGYQKEVEVISHIEQEENHWMQCLVACKQGKSFKPLEGWKDGKPVYGAEMKPSDEIEESLRMNINACKTIVKQKQEAISKFTTDFKNIIKRDADAIAAERAKRFAWVADPKLLDYTIETPEGEKTIKQVRSDISSIFPPYMRAHPAVESAGDLMVALMLARKELDSFKRAEKVTKAKEEEKDAIEPTSEVKPRKADSGVKLKGVPSTFSLKGAGDLGLD